MKMTADRFNLLCHVGDAVTLPRSRRPPIKTKTLAEVELTADGSPFVKTEAYPTGVGLAGVHVDNPRKITTKDIMAQWLEKNGFDGLAHIDGECGCERDNIAPCDQLNADCQPAFKRACDENCEHEGADMPGAWHMTTDEKDGASNE